MTKRQKGARPVRVSFQQWCALVELAGNSVTAGSHRVQDLHERIIRPFPLPGLASITRLAYSSVRVIAELSSTVASKISRQTQPLPPTDDPGSLQENSLSILNGVCGDYLRDHGNALAITMQIRASDPSAKRVALFVHGLCLNDSHWSEDMVAAVAALGFSPSFLRYNTGLGVRENAKLLLQELSLMQQPSSLIIIAHSMGGLVVRAGLAMAQQHRAKPAPWLDALRAVAYLGTPHAGAPLEQAGHWLEKIMARSPYASALAPIAQIRSQGIQDLRRGLAESDPSNALVLPYCEFVIAASLSSVAARDSGKTLRAAIRAGVGDGLVSIGSALAYGVLSELRLPSTRQRIIYGIGHLDLLAHPEVTAQLQQWLERPEFALPYDGPNN